VARGRRVLWGALEHGGRDAVGELAIYDVGVSYDPANVGYAGELEVVTVGTFEIEGVVSDAFARPSGKHMIASKEST
jgi:hypothetical protein